MKIRGFDIDVDFEAELEPFLGQFEHAKQRGNKLQACSPFRDERSPSFAVNLDDGLWIDSGAYDEDWRKGNFIKLIAFLHKVTYHEAEQYLFERYRTILQDIGGFKLKIEFPVEEKREPLSEERLEPYSYRHPYLGNRGIAEHVQKAFTIGYDKDSKSVSMPWRDKEGRLINVKFRRVDNKVFWYLSDGLPIKEHIYGLHWIYKKGITEAVVTESETDTLYLWSHGIPAIALGSAALSKRQEVLLKNSPLQTVVLGLDSDAAGRRCAEYMARRLLGLKDVYELNLPAGCKDINDIPKDRVEEVVSGKTAVMPKIIK